MTSGRSDLEALGRDELLARARKLGLARPELMTRLELIDELGRAASPDESDRRIARGLLGKARDLVARVMDLGLHLPDAAQRLRPPGAVPVEQEAPPPIATVALAGVYAAQGHRDQALAVLDEVLAREPAHQDALRLRRRIESESAQTSQQIVPPEPRVPDRSPSKPFAPAASDELRVDWSGSVARLVWHVRPRTFARHRAAQPRARLVLRMVQVHPALPQPEVRTLDVELDAFCGSRELPLDGPKERWCAAVGMRDGDRFEAIAAAV